MRSKEVPECAPILSGERWSRRGEELERRLSRLPHAEQVRLASVVWNTARDVAADGRHQEAVSGLVHFCYAAIRAGASPACEWVVAAEEGQAREQALLQTLQFEQFEQYARLCTDPKHCEKHGLMRRRGRPSAKLIDGPYYEARVRQYSRFLQVLEEREDHQALRWLSRRWYAILLGFWNDWMRRLVPVAVAAGGIAIILYFSQRNNARRIAVDSQTGLHAIIAEDGIRVIDASGNPWHILPKNEEPSDIIHISKWGDVTGDGSPDLILASIHDYEDCRKSHNQTDLCESRIWIYTLDADNRKLKLTDSFPAAPADYDQKFCRAQLQTDAHLYGDNADTRRRCAQRLGDFVTEQGWLYIAREWYGRDILARPPGLHTRPTRVFRVDSDVRSMAVVGPPNNRKLVIGTSCGVKYSKEGKPTPNPYGLLVLGNLPFLQKESFLGLTGSVIVDSIAESKILAYSNRACEGENANLSNRVITSQRSAVQPLLLVADISSAGNIQIEEEITLAQFCIQHQTSSRHEYMKIIHRNGLPSKAAVICRQIINGQRNLILLMFDLNRPLEKQSPLVEKLIKSMPQGKPEINTFRGCTKIVKPSSQVPQQLQVIPEAADLDDDGSEELLLSSYLWPNGTVALKIIGAASGLPKLQWVPYIPLPFDIFSSNDCPTKAD